MVSIMVDSDDPAVLQNNLFYNCRVATYADLLTPELVASFGGRLAVIDRGHGDPLNLAHILDVESGAWTVEAAGAKIKEWNSQGRGHIMGYVNRSNWQPLMEACAPVKPYQWIATLDGTLNPDGQYPSVVQFAGEAAIGLHVDVSIVYDENWFPLPAGVDAQQLASVRAAVAQLETLAAVISQGVARL